MSPIDQRRCQILLWACSLGYASFMLLAITGGFWGLIPMAISGIAGIRMSCIYADNDNVHWIVALLWGGTMLGMVGLLLPILIWSATK